jgi:hypothetical protein
LALRYSGYAATSYAFGRVDVYPGVNDRPHRYASTGPTETSLRHAASLKGTQSARRPSERQSLIRSKSPMDLRSVTYTSSAQAKIALFRPVRVSSHVATRPMTWCTDRRGYSWLDDRKLLRESDLDWLGGRDSNPDNVVQSHVSYR